MTDFSNRFRVSYTYANDGRPVWQGDHTTILEDAKCRRVGWNASVRELTYRDDAESHWLFKAPAAELNETSRFRATVRITRDGKSFGASQRDHDFPTLEAAIAHVDATFAKRAKAASKKFTARVHVGETVFTKDGELAVIRRIETARAGERQIYGLFCTGPLKDSTNAAGELNEFLLSGVH